MYVCRLIANIGRCHIWEKAKVKWQTENGRYGNKKSIGAISFLCIFNWMELFMVP